MHIDLQTYIHINIYPHEATSARNSVQLFMTKVYSYSTVNNYISFIAAYNLGVIL